MLFNSVEFAIFLPVVFFIYWFIAGRNIRLQNAFLLLASYFFYGWWDWRFLALIFISSSVDYLVGLGLGKTADQQKRKLLLITSIIVNIGFLGFFKYFNFFTESFQQAFHFFGQPLSDPLLLNIILPVGISFYTFQTLSYTIDLYKKKIEPTKDIIAFFAFVSFFPQLVAGPIERAASLLPQFHRQRVFNYENASDGIRQILWGLFKKVVVADNCAVYVDDIFSGHQELSGSTLLLGAILFSFQIYCDFSGYSDIAIGTARLFGFKLMRNFAFPYFSRDMAEFWRRWHISLSTWFRDYVYIPLGGSHGNKSRVIRNIFIVFAVSGFWHGANWTFILWGIINAFYLCVLILLGRNRNNLDIVAMQGLLPTLREACQVTMTFLLTSLTWIFFRAETIEQALNYLAGIFSASLFTLPVILPVKTLVFIFVLVIAEWLQRHQQHALQFAEGFIYQPVRWLIYFLITWSILIFGVSNQEFIYFQF